METGPEEFRELRFVVKRNDQLFAIKPKSSFGFALRTKSTDFFEDALKRLGFIPFRPGRKLS